MLPRRASARDGDAAASSIPCTACLLSAAERTWGTGVARSHAHDAVPHTQRPGPPVQLAPLQRQSFTAAQRRASKTSACRTGVVPFPPRPVSRRQVVAIRPKPGSSVGELPDDVRVPAVPVRRAR